MILLYMNTNGTETWENQNSITTRHTYWIQFITKKTYDKCLRTTPTYSIKKRKNSKYLIEVQEGYSDKYWGMNFQESQNSFET